MEFETHAVDVLVIGAGGAGLRAAIESSAQGAKTAIVCKSLLGKAHTVMAEGGIAAALSNVDTQDNWQTHFVDTMKGGKMINHWRMAQIHAQESPARVAELEEWGALFDRTSKGEILQRAFGGHKWRRLCHVGDRTGLEMIRTLQDRGVHQGIEVYMECTITKIILEGGVVAGAFGYWRESGRFVLFRAKAVILATGGIGKCYKITSNSWEYTGDGHALAYLAGAELIDMEFVQFHPTGMIWPPGVQGILVTEGVRGEGGILKNKNGERFMFRTIPDFAKKDFAETEAEAREWLSAITADRKTEARRPPELSTRDNVARAIYTEVKEGRGSEHGGVYLDISHLPADRVVKKLPSMFHQFKDLADVDITKTPMEVGPTCHYVMGGVKVDPEDQMSSIPGLFAAGEVAAGLHGANRLGGNSLSDLLVFGRRAGLFAAEYSKKVANLPSINHKSMEDSFREATTPFERTSGENPYELHRDLQEAMQGYVGIFRKEEDLKEGLRSIEDIKDRSRRVRVEGSRLYNPGWHLAMDLRNMLICAESVTRSALERKESRGAHSRLDFPKIDEEKFGNLNVKISCKEDRMSVSTVPSSKMPEELRTLFSNG